MGQLEQIVQLQHIAHAVGLGAQGQAHVEVADVNFNPGFAQGARQEAAFKT